VSNDSLSCAGTSIEINITNASVNIRAVQIWARNMVLVTGWMSVTLQAGTVDCGGVVSHLYLIPVQICTALIMMEVSNLRVSIIEHLHDLHAYEKGRFLTNIITIGPNCCSIWCYECI